MLSIDAAVQLLNDNSYVTPPFIVKWRNIYYRMSLHTTGACPSFRNLRFSNESNIGDLGTWYLADGLTYPIGWITERYDWIFDTFLLNRHPRENEVIRQWRKSQYKPYTQAPFQQVIDKAIGTIFAENNYSVTIADKEDNEYINGNNFHGKSLCGFIAEQFQAICEDPNGIFVAIPNEPYYKTSTPRIEPTVYFIPTRDIITITKDEVIFNLVDVAWVVNNIGYFRFEKGDDGKYFHIDDAYGGYYAHLMSRIPKHIAGGIWNTQGWYESYLKAAQAFADEFVSDKSAAQLVNKDSTHPYVTMASRNCPECDATGKTQYCRNCLKTSENCTCEESDTDIKPCSKCGGSGQMSWNPSNIMVAPPKDMGNDLIKVVNPDVKIPEYHNKNVADCYNGIMRALHQMYIEQAQSGKAKEKDMEGQYLFLRKISDGLFDLVEKLIIDILHLRNSSTAVNNATLPKPTDYIIVRPTQFAIKTEEDLLLEYDVATKANVPDYVRVRQLEEYVERLYGDDTVMKKKVCFINENDSLSVTTPADKLALVQAGGISQRDLQKSVEMPNIIDAIIRDKGGEWFCDANYEAIISEFETRFAKIPILPSVVATTALQVKES